MQSSVKTDTAVPTGRAALETMVVAVTVADDEVVLFALLNMKKNNQSTNINTCINSKQTTNCSYSPKPAAFITKKFVKLTSFKQIHFMPQCSI